MYVLVRVRNGHPLRDWKVAEAPGQIGLLLLGFPGSRRGGGHFAVWLGRRGLNSSILLSPILAPRCCFAFGLLRCRRLCWCRRSGFCSSSSGSFLGFGLCLELRARQFLFGLLSLRLLELGGRCPFGLFLVCRCHCVRHPGARWIFGLAMSKIEYACEHAQERSDSSEVAPWVQAGPGNYRQNHTLLRWCLGVFPGRQDRSLSHKRKGQSDLPCQPSNRILAAGAPHAASPATPPKTPSCRGRTCQPRFFHPALRKPNRAYIRELKARSRVSWVQRLRSSLLVFSG